MPSPAHDAIRCDVVVVGAGPAGAAAALALRRHAPSLHVVLLDRARFPRDKACGDAVAAHAFDELARLGVEGVEGDAPPVWDLDLRAPDGTAVVGRSPRPSRIIRRHDLDARLVDHAVRAGAVLHHHRVRSVRTTPGGVVLDDRWIAGHVIAADGANSVLRHQLGIGPPPDRHRAIAVRAYAPAGPDHDGQRIAMLADRWPAYAWSFPLGDGTANVGYGMRLSAAGGHRRQALLDRLDHVADGPADPGTIAIHPLPLSTGRPRPDHGPVLLVGDAAGLINPLTGEGIFYAIASGRMAGIAIAHAARGTAPEGAGVRYRRMLDRRFGRHLATTSAMARALDARWLFPIAVDAVRDAGAYADLAEIGLGEGVMTRRLARATAGAAVRAASRRVRASGPAGPSGPAGR